MATYTKETALYDTGAIKDGVDDAATKATAYLATGTTGIMVYDGRNGVQSADNPSSTTNNVFIDSDSLDIRRGTDVLATFGADGAQIGADLGVSKMIMSSDAITGFNPDGVPYFNIDMDGGATTGTAIASVESAIHNITLQDETFNFPEKLVNIDDYIGATNISIPDMMLGFRIISGGSWNVTAATNATTLVQSRWLYVYIASHSYTVGTSSNFSASVEVTINSGKTATITYNESYDNSTNKLSINISFSIIGSQRFDRFNISGLVRISMTTNACSLAFGTSSNDESNPQGKFASSLGEGLDSGGTHQTVIGKFNEADTNDDYAFIIGNGNGISGDPNERSNGFTVDWDGNVVASGSITSKLETATCSKYGSVWTSGDITLYKRCGVVQCLGAPTITAVSARTQIGVIPAKFRPAATMYILATDKSTIFTAYPGGSLYLGGAATAGNKYFSATWVVGD